MEKGKKMLNIALYIFLTLIFAYQVMGLISVIWGPELFDSAPPAKLQEAKGLVPTWIMMTLLVWGSVLLCKLWKDKEIKLIIPMILGIFGSLLALVVALNLRAALPLQAANSNVSFNGLQGLNGWKLLWRHYSPIGIGAISAIVSYVHLKDARDARTLRENEGYKEHFVLDGDPLFSDDEKEDTPAKPSKKLSKKQRKELQKKQNGGK